jgi:ketosteroid isomerase-like protein
MKPYLLILLLLIASSTFAQHAEDQIRNNRQASNAAIAAQDTAGIAKHWSPDIVVVTSRNARNIGKGQNSEAFAKEFVSKQSLIYIRTAEKVDVNEGAAMAAESGTWIGRWGIGGQPVVVGGTYYAKWVKSGESWLILAETYTLLHCEGDVYCKSFMK